MYDSTTWKEVFPGGSQITSIDNGYSVSDYKGTAISKQDVE